MLDSISLSSPTALTLAVVALLLYATYVKLLPKPLPGIAYNLEATLSIWGDSPSLAHELATAGEFSSWLGEQCLKMNSPVCQVFVQPLRMPWILVADFHEGQDILMRRSEFDKPQFLIDGLSALGDFHIRHKTNHDTFKSVRHLRQDLMTPTFLNTNVGPRLHSIGLELIELFESKSRLADGRPFSVRDDYASAALDIMLHHAFGADCDESALRPQLDLIHRTEFQSIRRGSKDVPVDFEQAELSPFLHSVHDTADVLERTTLSITPQLSFWWWSKQSWYQKIQERKNRVVPDQLRRSMANLESGSIKSALDHLMMREKAAAEKTGRQPQLFSKMMADEIFADLMTGSHTTGSAMAWVTKYLTGYPEAQTKLRSALYAALPQAVEENRLPTFEEIRRAKIPYLEAVIEEARRLTPFVIVREALSDTEILGRCIPKGSQVLMVSAGPGIMLPSVPVDESLRSASSKKAKPWGTWDDSRDLKIYEPERWLVTSEKGGVDFDGTAGPQLGFGMGVRQCWGKRLAHLAVRTVMALLVWQLEFLPVPDELGGYAGLDGISRQPVRAFARFKAVGKQPLEEQGAE